MRRYLQSMAGFTMMLILTLVMAAPAAAQEGDVVEVTFELTLYEEAAENDVFSVSYNIGSPMPGGGFGGTTQLRHVTLCAPTPNPEEPAVAPCERGRVHRSSITGRRGNIISYFFEIRGKPLVGARLDSQNPESKVVRVDTTIRATYPVGEQVPSALPSTGAGGLATTRIPISRATALITLLLVGGRALLLRR